MPVLSRNADDSQDGTALFVEEAASEERELTAEREAEVTRRRHEVDRQKAEATRRERFTKVRTRRRVLRIYDC